MNDDVGTSQSATCLLYYFCCFSLAANFYSCPPQAHASLTPYGLGAWRSPKTPASWCRNTLPSSSASASATKLENVLGLQCLHHRSHDSRAAEMAIQRPDIFSPAYREFAPEHPSWMSPLPLPRVNFQPVVASTFDRCLFQFSVPIPAADHRGSSSTSPRQATGADTTHTKRPPTTSSLPHAQSQGHI